MKMTKMAIILALVLMSSASAYAGYGGGKSEDKACRDATENARIEVNNGTHEYVGGAGCECTSYVPGWGMDRQWECTVKTERLPPREYKLVLPGN